LVDATPELMEADHTINFFFQRITSMTKMYFY